MRIRMRVRVDKKTAAQFLVQQLRAKTIWGLRGVIGKPVHHDK
jgi:hypothetical protein